MLFSAPSMLGSRLMLVLSQASPASLDASTPALGPTASEIEKNQSLLIFSIVLVNSEKINRFDEKSIANGNGENQSQRVLKINRFDAVLRIKNQSFCIFVCLKINRFVHLCMV